MYQNLQEIIQESLEYEAICNCDGGSRGNGRASARAAIGFVIKIKDQEYKYSKFLGIGFTNNYAEYTAVIECLKKLIELNIQTALIKADSQLLVNQLNNKYNVHSKNIFPLFNQIQKELLPKFKKCIFVHIPRSKNSIADKLVNQALDTHE